MVEPRGFEPPASSTRTTRASQTALRLDTERKGTVDASSRVPRKLKNIKIPTGGRTSTKPTGAVRRNNPGETGIRPAFDKRIFGRATPSDLPLRSEQLQAGGQNIGAPDIQLTHPDSAKKSIDLPHISVISEI